MKRSIYVLLLLLLSSPGWAAHEAKDCAAGLSAYSDYAPFTGTFTGTSGFCRAFERIEISIRTSPWGKADEPVLFITWYGVTGEEILLGSGERIKPGTDLTRETVTESWSTRPDGPRIESRVIDSRDRYGQTTFESFVRLDGDRLILEKVGTRNGRSESITCTMTRTRGH